MATETRCPRPEGPGRRPLHLRVGLLRRTRGDRLVVRQPDRPGHVGTRTTTPCAGPRDGVPGAARPVGVRGAGLGWETLVPLFRHAAIRRIDQVYEFRLDRRRLAGSPSGRAPGEELREV